MLVRRARTQTSAGIALVDQSTTSSSAKKVDFRVFCAGSSSASIRTLTALPSATAAGFSPLCLFTFWIHRHRTSTTSTVSPPLHLATPPFLFAVAREGAAAVGRRGWLRESERPPGARWHIRKSQRSESAAPRGHPLITQTTHRIHSLHFYLLVTLPTPLPTSTPPIPAPPLSLPPPPPPFISRTKAPTTTTAATPSLFPPLPAFPLPFVPQFSSLFFQTMQYLLGRLADAVSVNYTRTHTRLQTHTRQ